MYYTADSRCAEVVDALRSLQDAGVTPTTRRLVESCGTMAYNTAWKAVKRLTEEGVIRGAGGRGPFGQPCVLLTLEEWYSLDDEQRERMVRALESIAAHFEREHAAPVFNGPVQTVNTGTVVYESRERKVAGPEETK